jgi:hypothetical protein
MCYQLLQHASNYSEQGRLLPGSKARATHPLSPANHGFHTCHRFVRFLQVATGLSSVTAGPTGSCWGRKDRRCRGNQGDQCPMTPNPNPLLNIRRWDQFPHSPQQTHAALPRDYRQAKSSTRSDPLLLHSPPIPDTSNHPETCRNTDTPRIQ